MLLCVLQTVDKLIEMNPASAIQHIQKYFISICKVGFLLQHIKLSSCQALLFSQEVQ